MSAVENPSAGAGNQPSNLTNDSEAQKRGERKRLLVDLARSQRSAKLRAIGLILPLLLFLLVVFVVPIATLLSRSVSDTVVGPVLPRTISALSEWHGSEAPPDAAFAALVEDLQKVPSKPLLAQAAARLNYSTPGMRSLLMSTSSKLPDEIADPRQALLEISEEWSQPRTWAAIKQAKGPLTDFYLLSALDLRRNAQGEVIRAPEVERVFVATIWRTFEISLGVTALTLLIGFPFTYLVSAVSDRWARLLMFTVLLPFWTAVLVRTLSWAVLLQKQGVINQALISLGVTDEPFSLLYNRFAIYIALVHIFLPFMVLPLYSVMKTIPPSQMRAAASLGAPPFRAFTNVYLPQVLPGIAAGALLVFIQCLGVFVTPAILGGANDQGISYMIAFYVNQTLNWGLAAALSIILLMSVLIFFWLFKRLAGVASLQVR